MTDTMTESEITTSELVARVSQAAGQAAKMINTGGNCGAVAFYLENGAEVLVTDGDVFGASGSDQTLYERWIVGVYPPNDEHCDGACVTAEGPDGDFTVEALQTAIASALTEYASH